MISIPRGSSNRVCLNDMNSLVIISVFAADAAVSVLIFVTDSLLQYIFTREGNVHIKKLTIFMRKVLIFRLNLFNGYFLCYQSFETNLLDTLDEVHV